MWNIVACSLTEGPILQNLFCKQFLQYVKKKKKKNSQLMHVCSLILWAWKQVDLLYSISLVYALC